MGWEAVETQRERGYLELETGPYTLVAEAPSTATTGPRAGSRG